MYAVKLKDPGTAQKTVQAINTRFSDVHAALSAEFADEMPDMQNSAAMMNGISFMAILLGGLGVMNTMLMAVMERTREIGVLRSMGWRRRSVLGMIVNESVLLGTLGGLSGIILGLILGQLFKLDPSYGAMLQPDYNMMMFGRTILVAVFLGGFGGIYPAIRASQQPPVEALRYE